MRSWRYAALIKNGVEKWFEDAPRRSESGVEDTVCGGCLKATDFLEGSAQTHGAAKNGDEAMLLYATQKIAAGVFKRVDSFVILARARCSVRREYADPSTVFRIGTTGHQSE